MHVSRKYEGDSPMTSWTKNDLERIGAADELQLTSFKEDGMPRKPVTIGVVRVGDDLYVRAYRGRETAWFRHLQRRHEGRIVAGGVTKDVTLVDVSDDEALNNEIDAVYQSKYRRYSATYVDPMIALQARAIIPQPSPGTVTRWVMTMIAPQARATTLKLVPSE